MYKVDLGESWGQLLVPLFIFRCFTLVLKESYARITISGICSKSVRETGAYTMILKKIAAVKGEGRKMFFGMDNLLALIFIITALTFSLANGQNMFAYFCMGLVVVRVGEVIFELKSNMFDRPFFHYLVGIGIPLQIAWNVFG